MSFQSNYIGEKLGSNPLSLLQPPSAQNIRKSKRDTMQGICVGCPLYHMFVYIDLKVTRAKRKEREIFWEKKKKKK